VRATRGRDLNCLYLLNGYSYRKISCMRKDAHESGNSNELGLKTTGKEMKKKLLNKMWEKLG